MATEMPTEELCDRFDGIYTGAVTDVLDDHGYYDQTLDVDIEPLKRGMTTAGPAYPIRGRPNFGIDEEENIRKILRMLGSAPEHAVLVYDTNDTGEASHLGELSIEALMQQDCNGAVVDGGIRDVVFMLEEDFPVFSKYHTPADAVIRWEILEWDVSTTVGGVEIEPGDIIVGDVDGVVSVPQEIAVDVLHDVEELAETEDAIREAVRGGATPLEAYEEYGVF